jgi:hypothetical protein
MSETVDIPNVRAKRCTLKALLCLIDGAEVWVPKSQISCTSEVYYAGGRGTLRVTRWWADKVGLVDDDGHATVNRRTALIHIQLTETTRIFRQLAFEFHPDRNASGASTMRALNQLIDAVREDLARAGDAWQ